MLINGNEKLFLLGRDVGSSMLWVKRNIIPLRDEYQLFGHDNPNVVVVPGFGRHEKLGVIAETIELRTKDSLHIRVNDMVRATTL